MLTMLNALCNHLQKAYPFSWSLGNEWVTHLVTNGQKKTIITMRGLKLYGIVEDALSSKILPPAF